MERLEEAIKRLETQIDVYFKKAEYITLIFDLGKIFHIANNYLEGEEDKAIKIKVFERMKRLEPFFLEKKKLFENSKVSDLNPMTEELKIAFIALEIEKHRYAELMGKEKIQIKPQKNKKKKKYI